MDRLSDPERRRLLAGALAPPACAAGRLRGSSGTRDRHSASDWVSLSPGPWSLDRRPGQRSSLTAPRCASRRTRDAAAALAPGSPRRDLHLDGPGPDTMFRRSRLSRTEVVRSTYGRSTRAAWRPRSRDLVVADCHNGDTLTDVRLQRPDPAREGQADRACSPPPPRSARWRRHRDQRELAASLGVDTGDAVRSAGPGRVRAGLPRPGARCRSDRSIVPIHADADGLYVARRGRPRWRTSDPRR